MDNTTITNILGAVGAGAFSLLAWFASQWAKSTKEAVAILAKKMETVEMEMDEIKHNYVDRFDKVNEKIDRGNREIARKIEEVIKDRSAYEVTQARAMGSMETKIDNLVDVMRRQNNH